MNKSVFGINSFILKVVAIIGMTANHTAHAFINQLPPEVTFILFSLGGLTFPIMAFLMVVGYEHTSSVKKYAIRLAIFAVISQVPYYLLLASSANVLFTLLLSLGILWAHDNIKNRWLFGLIFVALVAISYFCDWGLIGPVMVYLFYILRKRRFRGVWIGMLAPYAYKIIPVMLYFPAQLNDGINRAATAISQGMQNSVFLYDFAGLSVAMSNELFVSLLNLGYALIGFTIAAILMASYNGKRGFPMKWFFYAYYPVHIFIIWIVKQFILG